MKDDFSAIILQCTGARAFEIREVIQELWSGYGKIMRIALQGSSRQSIVVKHVQLPQEKYHPRGWNTDLGHQRKVRSYQVESHWYETYSRSCAARVPYFIAKESRQQEMLLVLEDLDASGYSLRKRQVTWDEIEACLRWLAQFHASHMGRAPKGLWDIGTYWHLDTRPQELAALNDHALKEAAAAIDDKLNACRYKTFVHGDAKLANFCFANDGRVSGVDFQYVGGGCGMKDVAYFIGSCLAERECELREAKILDTYFKYLSQEMEEHFEALEKEWRPLYRVAWADFHRFIKGWSPGHWKLNDYSERVVADVINNL